MVSEASKAQVMTDFSGVHQLKQLAKSDQKQALSIVAKQFEGIMMQMVLKSMRDANNAMRSELFSHDTMDFYQDMFDQQLAMTLGEKGVGIAKMLEKQLSPTVPDGKRIENYNKAKEIIEEK